MPYYPYSDLDGADRDDYVNPNAIPRVRKPTVTPTLPTTKPTATPTSTPPTKLSGKKLITGGTKTMDTSPIYGRDHTGPTDGDVVDIGPSGGNPGEVPSAKQQGPGKVSETLYPIPEIPPPIFEFDSSKSQPLGPATPQPAPYRALPLKVGPQPVHEYEPVEGYQPKSYDPAEIAKTIQQSVAHQIRDIIHGNSPIMRAARTRSQQQMNSRGLLNSSLAIGEGERAVYDAAMPIAVQDAATAYQQAVHDQAAENQARAFEANAQNIALDQAKAGEIALRQTAIQGAEQREGEINRGQIQNFLNQEQHTRNWAIQNLRHDQAVKLEHLASQYAGLRQASASIAQYASSMNAAIAAIYADPNIPADRKEDMFNSMIQQGEAHFRTFAAMANAKPIFNRETGTWSLEGVPDFEVRIARPGGTTPSSTPSNQPPGYRHVQDDVDDGVGGR